MDVLAHAEAAEAKQRRPAPPSEPGRLVADLVAAAEVGPPGSADGAEKGRRSWAAAFRALAGRVHRRRDDAVAASMLWVAWVLGYLYATEELLQPPEAPVVVLMSALCHGVFAMAILSWIGVIYHGPGRVPGEEQPSQLPPAIAAALSAGRFSGDRPFGHEDSWCAACERWKPPLAHHCSICGQCGLWMDHHCNFAMQCVGFRNLRCFLVMLFYTQLLCFLLAPLAVRRLLVEPALDAGAGARLAAFSAGWLALVRFVRYFTRTVVAKTSAGWPSHVLLVKYQAIFEYAVEMEKRQLDRQQAGAPAPHLQELRQLLRRLRRRGGGLRGFLRAGDLLGSLALVFGEPPSWRWLLPLLPGGSGDPLRPAVFDAGACGDWASLAQLLSACNAAVAAGNAACAQAVGLWSRRMQAMLAGAEQASATGTPGVAATWASAAAVQAAASPVMASPKGNTMETVMGHV